MKMAIVSSKHVGTVCWSAKRFTGGCHECERVERLRRPGVYRCQLPEAKFGRVLLANRRIDRAKQGIIDAAAKKREAEVAFERAKKLAEGDDDEGK
jgi:hypothetical protein